MKPRKDVSMTSLTLPASVASPQNLRTVALVPRPVLPLFSFHLSEALKTEFPKMIFHSGQGSWNSFPLVTRHVSAYSLSRVRL
jgi:hypothetical protein